jgi:hypothetical protein
VSRDWEWIQRILGVRFEEFRVAEAHFFYSVFMHFSKFAKCMHWRFLILQLLCKWIVTITDHSLLSVLYMYDLFFNRYVTPWMKNWSVMLITGSLHPFIFTFCHRHSNFRLLDLSASEHWSPVMICGCYSSFAELLSKPSKQVF